MVKSELAHGPQQVDGRVEAAAHVFPLSVRVELVVDLDAQVLVLLNLRELIAFNVCENLWSKNV